MFINLLLHLLSVKSLMFNICDSFQQKAMKSMSENIRNHSFLLLSDSSFYSATQCFNFSEIGCVIEKFGFSLTKSKAIYSPSQDTSFKIYDSCSLFQKYSYQGS